MAYAMLAIPGKVVSGIEIGPCVEDCTHTDCAETRAQASSPCHLCGKVIGYEIKFQSDAAGKLVHLKCALSG